MELPLFVIVFVLQLVYIVHYGPIFPGNIERPTNQKRSHSHVNQAYSNNVRYKPAVNNNNNNVTDKQWQYHYK